MRRRSGLVLALALAATALASPPGCASPETERPPHLVVLIVDMLRADYLGSYGQRRPTSPELDALAANGVRLAHTVSQSPWTRPSIGSMLTSLHPRTIGIYEEQGHVLDDRFVTLAEVLREHGYLTQGTTANPNINASFRFDQGFDRYWSTDVVWAWMRPTTCQKAAEKPDFPPAPELFARLLEARAQESPAERARPHYVQINLMDVHQAPGRPEVIRSEFLDLFLDVKDDTDRRYLQMVRQISLDIEAFVEDWIADPDFEDTVFAIVSDHGVGLTSHPGVPGWQHRLHGFYLYESHLLVPWILYHPGDRLPRGLVIEGRVRLLDVMPTLLDMLGVPGPPGMAGTSLWPAVQGGALPALPEAFFVETSFREAEKVGVYTPRWRYYENRDGLVDLNARALHMAGVMGDGRRTDVGAAHPDLLDVLAAEVARWERAHPRAVPAFRDRLTDREREQLRSLGYLDSEDREPR